MHDTVTKLLDYAEGYARAYRGSTYERHAARQALQDELTLLFTPLTDEQIRQAGHLNVEGERMLPYSFARAIEQMHGITGEKNETT